jgi:c-di-GMP-binding flagellar brake protein YcgR
MAMPASIAVPEWQLSLQKLALRNGVMELEPADAKPAPQAHVVVDETGEAQAAQTLSWRVRLLKLDGQSVIIERPTSAHQPVVIKPGDAVTGTMLEGSTRWSLSMVVIEQLPFKLNGAQSIVALRLSWPKQVTNAQRREFFRVDTAGAIIPPLTIWKLADPASCVEFERYNELVHKMRGRSENIPKPHFPQIADPFSARLIDLSGGGLCVSVARTLKTTLDEKPMLWLQLTLPEAVEPYYAAARIAHTHIESALVMQLGLSFSFEHNPPHKRFMVDEMCRFANKLQRLQLQRTR